ncbi:bifunctional adenosylcobinamide kinase/adenosylcobinamide-phosphate guanylyltransferase [Brevibacillus sp. TJ4]|uniref:bifunctional adenosylcobinamide kinase/adenosylcobinamide-phosphate guanylyltransferase n=1 Tax=Brevibacillus sp. TJ4 TaxID=3234853 RepID=UPI0037D0317F
MAILVTGGARSGKSSFAESYAAHLGKRGIYIATSPVFDDELESRVRLHRQRRDQSSFSWETIEEQFALDSLLQKLGEREEVAQKETVVLVDCLTLWLSNWLLRLEYSSGEAGVLQQIDALQEAIRRFPGSLLLVTNEVGYGIVPEHALGRMFRDLAGILNQRTAKACEQVFLVTAGIPLEIKSRAFHMERNNNPT